MFLADDLLNNIFLYLSRDAVTYSRLSLVSKQFLSATESLCKKCFFDTFPTAQGIITRNFRSAYVQSLIHVKKQNRNHRAKCGVFGGGAVGKSATAIRISMPEVSHAEYDPTMY
jgi:hypothetical protein